MQRRPCPGRLPLPLHRAGGDAEEEERDKADTSRNRHRKHSAKLRGGGKQGLGLANPAHRADRPVEGEGAAELHLCLRGATCVGEHPRRMEAGQRLVRARADASEDVTGPCKVTSGGGSCSFEPRRGTVVPPVEDGQQLGTAAVLGQKPGELGNREHARRSRGQELQQLVCERVRLGVEPGGGECLCTTRERRIEALWILALTGALETETRVLDCAVYVATRGTDHGANAPRVRLEILRRAGLALSDEVVRLLERRIP